MARRSKGIKVAFKKVVRARTKAFPFLKPALQQGKVALRKQLKKAVATLSSKGKTAGIKVKLSLAVEKAAVFTMQAAKRKVHYRSGDLRRSINVRSLGLYSYSVGTGLPYGKYLEEGTKGGQVIRPKTKKALSFVWANAPAGIRRRFSKRGRKRR